MPDHNEPFTPQSVDEQIEQFMSVDHPNIANNSLILIDECRIAEEKRNNRHF